MILTKRIQNNLDGNYTRILGTVSNHGNNTVQNSCCTATCLPSRKVRRESHAGYCWRSMDELINDFLFWTPSHSHASIGRPAQTYTSSANTGRSLEYLPGSGTGGDRERARELHAVSMTL